MPVHVHTMPAFAGNETTMTMLQRPLRTMAASKRAPLPHDPTTRRAVARAAALCATLGAGVSPLASAQEAAPQEAASQVVTIIGNSQDPQSSTGSAYVLTARELRKFEAANINSVLRAVPGVYVREEDGLGTFPNIGSAPARRGAAAASRSWKTAFRRRCRPMPTPRPTTSLPSRAWRASRS